MFCQMTKKRFLKYTHSKRRSKESIGPILDEDGHLTNGDEDKREAFNAFLLPQSSVLITDLGVPGPVSRKTMAAGAVTFHLWALKL